MPYNYGWSVQEPNSGNEFTHQEGSDGVLTSGQYRVNLPDGRVQVVTYTVQGDSGYQAEVTYEGEAQYPPVGAGQRYTGAPGSPRYVVGAPQQFAGADGGLRPLDVTIDAPFY
ncbi:pro-resilin-like [Pollicipes pollicipes]|uniref:pro-resilin-like n=1 Tax=Pollicipes pollicipes TaxID=41117 RepID=UPI0018856DB7|nr:pro-resilin-like [Pollicipes pollicipes]